MPRKRTFVPKSGSIGKAIETPFDETASGIVNLPEKHQLHTVRLCETPQLLHAIALATIYPEVKKTALDNYFYPHPPKKLRKKSKKKLVATS